MASPTTPQRRRAILLAVLLVASASPMATLAAGGGGCRSEKLPAGRQYASCADLPTLGAALHWTYDANAATLSVAFVAKPAGGAGGWVSWAINPSGDGMKGAQALVAMKSAAAASSGTVYAVKTYNITGYSPLGAAATPVAFNVSDLAADESGGKIRLYGKLQLHHGMEAVNHIWQVGSTVTAAGAPAKHALAKENLESKGKLVLSGGGGGAPAPVAGGSPSGEAGNMETHASPPLSGGKSPAAATYASAPVIMLVALAGFLVPV